jgi:hypothetical protein
MRRTSLALSCIVLAACGSPPPAVDPPPRHAGPPIVLWQEHFNEPRLDWVDPFKRGPKLLARVFSIRHDGDLYYLHARHDYTGDDPPPAPDYGKAFVHDPPPLERVRALKWRWRVLRHPNVTDDAWLDVAASLYVIIKVPSLFFGGHGFKFGWLAKPGAVGTYQHGLLQIELRHDPASQKWHSESVDLCALYRKYYGSCEGQHVLYIGVVTDADGTHSIAEGDYADFELVGDR